MSLNVSSSTSSTTVSSGPGVTSGSSSSSVSNASAPALNPSTKPTEPPKPITNFTVSSSSSGSSSSSSSSTESEKKRKAEETGEVADGYDSGNEMAEIKESVSAQCKRIIDNSLKSALLEKRIQLLGEELKKVKETDTTKKQKKQLQMLEADEKGCMAVLDHLKQKLIEHAAELTKLNSSKQEIEKDCEKLYVENDGPGLVTKLEAVRKKIRKLIKETGLLQPEMGHATKSSSSSSSSTTTSK